MTTIVTRAGKGTPLTNAEVDQNFSGLNTDKLELGGTFSSGTANSILYLNGSKVVSSSSDITFDGSRLATKEFNALNGIFINKQSIATNSTIESDDNAMSASPISVNAGVTVTVSSGSVWTIV